MTDSERALDPPMQPHPEGGRYRELFRSARQLDVPRVGERCALTHIEFELRADEASRFHLVTSDEVWNLYRGHARVHLWNAGEETIRSIDLCAAERRFSLVVPAGVWQATEPVDGDLLVGCSVAPGFDFEDFTMIDDAPGVAAQLRTLRPDLARLIDPPEGP